MFHDEFRFPVVQFPTHAARFADEDPDKAGATTQTEEPPKPDADTETDEGKDWKQEAIRRAQESKKYRQRAQDAETRLRDLEGRVVTDEERAELDKLRTEREQAEQKKMEEQGKYQDLIKQKDDKHKKDLAERDAAVGKLSQALQDIGANTPLLSALAGAGVDDPDNAAFLLQSRYQYHVQAELDKDGRVVTRVVDRNGEQVYDAEVDGAPPLAIPKLVAQWLHTPAGQRFLPPSKDTGSGAKKGGPGSVDLAELNSDINKLQDFIEKHGTEAYMKLMSNADKKKGVAAQPK